MHEDPSKHQIEHEAERDSVLDDRVLEANGLINEVDNEQEIRTVIESKTKNWKIYLNKFCRIWNTGDASKTEGTKT